MHALNTSPHRPLSVQVIGRTLPLLAGILCLLFISSPALEARKVSRVIIDAGHGGHDPGAGKNGVEEKKLTLNVALHLEKLLKAKGIPVTMTRSNDTFISLAKRAEIGNEYSNAVFVSIHFNANRDARVYGVETYYYGSQGRKLANHVHLRLLSHLKTRDGRIRQQKNFAVLNQTKSTAILVECGYVSNTSERSRCNSYAYQYSCAKAIADGIWAYKTYN